MLGNRRKKEIPLGFAWEKDMLRVVDLQRLGREYKVKANSFPLPEEITGPDFPDNHRLLGDMLQSLRKEYGWGRRRVVTALPTDQITVRHVRLPVLTGEELVNAVHLEAKVLLGAQLTDYVYDYLILDEETSEKEPSHLTVMLAAIQRQKALTLYRAFAWAGCNLTAIDIVPLALQRALINPTSEVAGKSPTLLLDLGNYCSQLVIVSKGKPVFSRALSLGFPKKMSDTKSSSNSGIWDKAQNLLQEMRRSLDYYQARSRHEVKKLIVSGPGSRWLCNETSLSDLGLTVSIGVPGQGLVLDHHPNPCFAVALGLALKGVRD